MAKQNIHFSAQLKQNSRFSDMQKAIIKKKWKITVLTHDNPQSSHHSENLPHTKEDKEQHLLA